MYACVYIYIYLYQPNLDGTQPIFEPITYIYTNQWNSVNPNVKKKRGENFTLKSSNFTKFTNQKNHQTFIVNTIKLILSTKKRR